MTNEHSCIAAIVGVGLIGGSLAKCLQEAGQIQVRGYSPRQSSVDRYLQLQVVDSGSTDLQKVVANADFIFLCCPVAEIPAYLLKLSSLQTKLGCIISDVGSTKAEIMKAAQATLRKDQIFVGGHPMAGSERSGVEAADRDLFENAYYVLTPGKQHAASQKLAALLSCTRAQIVSMDPDQHDEVVGATSHLPHIVAAALVNVLGECHEENDWYRLLTAGGFRDITRIASSDPALWRDILLSNRGVLFKLLNKWEGQLERLTNALQAENREELVNWFTEARDFRNNLPERKKGLIGNVHELYLDVPDHPGVIGQVTTILGEQQISLRNIAIMESRVEVPGVLRITFRNEADYLRAQETLQNAKYKVVTTVEI